MAEAAVPDACVIAWSAVCESEAADIASPFSGADLASSAGMLLLCALFFAARLDMLVCLAGLHIPSKLLRRLRLAESVGNAQ